MMTTRTELRQSKSSMEFIWPDNKRFAVCLTHDVDRIKKTYQYITKSKNGNIRQIRQLFTSGNPYWGFPIIMNLEDKFDVRSTFFFLQESKKINLLRPKDWALSIGKYRFDNKKVYEIIQILDRNGWEIGLHGSYESCKHEDLLREEKKELQQVLGAEVTGIRQHYLQLEVPQTWKIQHEVGFLYDASFGFRDRIGFREERYLPFHPFDNSFLEIPLALMDGALFSNYGNEDAVWGECLNLIKTTEKQGGLLTVLWHQRVFNEDEFPGWGNIYTKILKECRERGAYFGTCKDIHDLWVRNE
jgi:peptidoglycan/xylan/chitin deacetylase (PgdA/CDA1 family)